MSEGKVPFDRPAHLQLIRAKANEAKAELRESLGPKPDDYKPRWQMLPDGELTVQDLDDEELKEMRTKSRLGDFSGRPPKAIPSKLARDMRAEWLARGQAKLEFSLHDAAETSASISKNPKVPAKDRIAASLALLDRGLGKVPDKVEVTQHDSDPWATIIDGVLTEDKLERIKEIAEGA